MEDTLQIQDTEAPEQQPVPQDPPSKKLYNGLIEEKMYSKSYDEFRKQYSTPESLTKLHDGLIEEKLYSKGKDDFINQYFPELKKKEDSPSPSLDGRLPSVAKETYDFDPLKGVKTEFTDKENPKSIDYALNTNELEKNKTTVDKGIPLGGMAGGGDYSTSVDPEIQKEIDNRKESQSTLGLNTDNIVEHFKDIFPKLPQESKDYFNNLINTNPTRAISEISAAKVNNDMKQGDAKIADLLANNDVIGANKIKQAQLYINNIDAANNDGTKPNYSQMRQRLQDALPAIKTVVDSPDKTIDNLTNEAASAVYGQNLLPTQKDGKWYYPSSDVNLKRPEFEAAGLNKYHAAALDMYHDLMPDKYEAYKNILLPLDKRDDKNVDQKLGLQEYEMRVEEDGMNLAHDAATSNYNDAKANGDTKAMEMYKTEIGKIETDQKNVLDKYPLMKIIQAQKDAIDINGSDKNAVDLAATKIGIGVENIANGITNYIARPFMSEEKVYKNTAEILGEGDINEVMVKSPETDNTTIHSKIIMSGNAKKAIDDINAQDISKTEKNSQITDYLLKNPNEVRNQGLSKPESNVTLKTIALGTMDIAANLVPLVAGTYMTGGSSSLAIEVGLLAIPIMQSNLYKAIKSGDPNPYTIGARDTFIDAAAMMAGGKLDIVKEMAVGIKNPAIKKMILEMPDEKLYEAIEKAKANPIYQKASIAFDKTIEAAKSSLKLTVAMTVGDIAKDKLNGTVVDYDQKLKEGSIEALKFWALGTAGGALHSVGAKADDFTKLSIFNAAKNTEGFIEHIDLLKEKGKITPEEHAELKTNIELAKKVYENTPLVDAKGKPLSEKGQRDLLYLKLQETKTRDLLKKDIPEPLRKILIERVNDITTQADKVYNGSYILDDSKKNVVKSESQPEKINPNDTSVIKGSSEEEKQKAEQQASTGIGDVGFLEKGGNKVVDEKGEPITVYHSSNEQNIENFKTKGEIETAAGKVENYGIYFTPNKGEYNHKGSKEYEVKISIKKPYITKDQLFSAVITKEKYDKLISDGYDGVILERNGKPDEYIVFDNSQIKKIPQPKVEASNSIGSKNKGIEVYHGTPHGFDKFDISKLGTGEGAQAFGHGLYFTNEKGIAETYANTLSSKKNFWQHLMDGNDISMSKEDFDFVSKELDSLGFDGERAENENLGNIKVDGKDEHAPSVLDALSVLFGKNAKSELEGYDLSSKEIDRMMDIKKKISNPKLYKATIVNGDYLDWHSNLTDTQKNKLKEIDTNGNGEQVYKNLSKKLGGDKQASDYLESKGVDGIIYKSNKVTGGKEGIGRNYVVFNHDKISIDEINGEKQQLPQPKGEANKASSSEGNSTEQKITSDKVSELETKKQKDITEASRLNADDIKMEFLGKEEKLKTTKELKKIKEDVMAKMIARFGDDVGLEKYRQHEDLRRNFEALKDLIKCP